MEYNEFTYVYPPRPSQQVPKSLLGFYEKHGYLAQVKKNGTCTVIFARGLDVTFMTRHNDYHKQWTAQDLHKCPFQSSSLKYNVFAAELIHSKTKLTKNQLYIFDTIVLNGVQLVGTTFAERQAMLHSMLGGKDEGHQTRVNEFVSVANSFNRRFTDVWNSLSEEDEGIVLKKATGKLEPCFNQSANTGWQCKSRKSTKNYSF
jgi:hypothetical protein